MPKPPGFDAAVDRLDAITAEFVERSAAAEAKILDWLRIWSESDSQGTIAKELGVSKPYVNDLLRGRRQWPRRVRPKQRSGKKPPHL